MDMGLNITQPNYHSTFFLYVSCNLVTSLICHLEILPGLIELKVFFAINIDTVMMNFFRFGHYGVVTWSKSL